ncbi:MAG: hypothetical protein FJZ01_26605 [Candidatus Sericytochromatia bacterium]|nr:hypothetical protein [Candidatus Tanganyikabacteria bacterium]
MALRERVEEWRRTRPCFGPMPADLWAEAVSVAQKRGLYVTARSASLDYGGLARRLAVAEAATPPQPEAVAFVEWSGADILGSRPGAGVEIEMSDRDGRRMTLRAPSGESFGIAAIVSAFWGARA